MVQIVEVVRSIGFDSDDDLTVLMPLGESLRCRLRDGGDSMGYLGNEVPGGEIVSSDDDQSIRCLHGVNFLFLLLLVKIVRAPAGNRTRRVGG